MTEAESVVDWLRHPGTKVLMGMLGEIKAELLHGLLNAPATDAGKIGSLQGQIKVIETIQSKEFHQRLKQEAVRFLT